MADYWGAQATYAHGGPRGEGTRYVMPPENPDLKFTPAPGGAGGATIEAVRQQVLGQHPEDISALADQWQNAYNLLQSIHQQLLSASQTLHDEHWKSPQARDAFLKAGPGKTLAYLDEWMDAAQHNVTALRAMVGIARDSRAEMERLWTEYREAIDDAKNSDGWTQFSEGFKQGFTLGLYDGEKGIQAAEAEAVQEKQEEYNRRAQELARRTADDYFDTLSKVSGGHGPPFFPMDAVLNPVGHPPWRGPVGTPPPVRPPGARPPGVGATPPPASVRPVPRPGGPDQLARQVLDTLRPPPEAGAPAPTPGTDERAGPAVAPPPVVPPPLVAPPPGLSTGAPVPSGGTANATGAGRAGLARPPGLDGLAGERGLRSGVLRGGAGAPAVSEPPQASLRSPGANATPPPTGGRTAPPNGLRGPGAPSTAAPPTGARGNPATGSPHSPASGRPGSGQQADPARRGTARPGAGDEDLFGRPAGETTAPVLQNRRPPERRTSGGAGRAAGGQAGDASTPTRPGIAPPVLGSPTRGAGVTGTPRSKRRDRAGAAQPATPGGEWWGDDRSEATAPVLDAPAAPLSGGRVSRLEEVPGALRGRPTAEPTTRRARGGQPVPPELAPRRTTAAKRDDREGHGDGPGIVTDEQAFSVETPGGGVLGKQAEDRSYRAEPKTALGGN
ncbi:WXG100 family type VII secretion target [Micromonospora humida]|uniref:WXG100 family type VII secretion target n=1 Tax=Micromonospora humida TaxID=2809018 RepID=UPI003403D838